MKKTFALLLALLMLLALLCGCSVSEEQARQEARTYYEDVNYAKNLLETGKLILSSDDEEIVSLCSSLLKTLKESPNMETAYDVTLQFVILSGGKYQDPETMEEITAYSEKALSFIQKETKITMDQVPWWSFSKCQSVRTLFQKGKFSSSYPFYIDWLISAGMNLWS